MPFSAPLLCSSSAASAALSLTYMYLDFLPCHDATSPPAAGISGTQVMHAMFSEDTELLGIPGSTPCGIPIRWKKYQPDNKNQPPEADIALAPWSFAWQRRRNPLLSPAGLEDTALRRGQVAGTKSGCDHPTNCGKRPHHVLRQPVPTDKANVRRIAASRYQRRAVHPRRAAIERAGLWKLSGYGTHPKGQEGEEGFWPIFLSLSGWRKRG